MDYRYIYIIFNGHIEYKLFSRIRLYFDFTRCFCKYRLNFWKCFSNPQSSWKLHAIFLNYGNFLPIFHWYCCIKNKYNMKKIFVEFQLLYFHFYYKALINIKTKPNKSRAYNCSYQCSCQGRMSNITVAMKLPSY